MHIAVFDPLTSHYNEQDDANMQYSKQTYPLTTWLHSLSRLCQRAFLCPAETQEDKYQQTTKRLPWGPS